MITARGLLLLSLLMPACDTGEGEQAPSEEALPPVDRALPYVDPFIGSGGFGYAAGSAYPGAMAPNGMAKVGPDTKGPYGDINFLHYSGYWYGDNVVQGFSHMHLVGTGASDYGVLGLMPVPAFDPQKTTQFTYGSPFKKASESAAPGYYAVTLDQGPVRVEITATGHAAHHRYLFGGRPATGTVVLDLDHHLNGGSVPLADLTLQKAEGKLSGRLHSMGGMSGGYGGYDVFFVARARRTWSGQVVWHKDTAPAPGEMTSGEGAGAALTFDTSGDGTVEVQVGLSLVSIEGAQRNLDAEMPGWDFEGERRGTADAWEHLVGAIKVDGGTAAERRTFYSSLYRAYHMPSIHSDVDGQYRAHDGTVRQADGWRFVSDLSLWDTYRTLNPLYAFLAPERARDVARSLHEMARARGAFPKWPLAGGESGVMIGASAEIVLADSYARGVRDFDAEGAYAILRAAAMDRMAPKGGRGGRDDIEPYMDLGYVPARVGSSVSETTEFSRDDFALGQLAGALGKADDAKALAARALGYRKLFDPATGFLRARNDDGTLEAGSFDPISQSRPYREANAWQTLWGVPHDAAGLVGLFGGQDALVRKLSELFEQGQADWEASDPKAPLSNAAPRPYYWAGNEPDIHAGYMFAQVGRPELTARWVRWAMDTYYGDGADGLPGNDDGGTMSAWYVWSALGIFPLPGSDRYILGAPRFPRARVAVAGGVLTIEAAGLSKESTAVMRVELDGVPVSGQEVRHGELRAGRTLRFVMGPPPG